MPHWTIEVDDKTDRAIRTHIARQNGNKGDLSSFVAEAARRLAMRQDVEAFRTAFAEESSEEIETMVAEAVEAARAKRA